MNPSDIIATLSLAIAIGALGLALWMFDEQHKESRIDNFVTRYIAMIREEGSLVRDVHGFATMLDAGVLWLKSNNEVREAVIRIKACRVRQPCNDAELEGDLLAFFKTALSMREGPNDTFGIIRVKMKAQESATPPI